MATQTTTAKTRTQPAEFGGDLLVLRSKHGDDGNGSCLSGCGPFPCALREWTDRAVEILAESR